MVDKEIGRLAKLPLRAIWKQEDRDFTPWLRDHIDQLADELGMTLEAQGIEVPVGRYKLDLLAINPETGRNVVIENQLERADHSHMGQLVTYAAGLKAEVAVLIAERFGDEERAALEWLNESTPSGAVFFGIEVQAVNIGDSAPAAMFRTVVSPNGWSRGRPSAPGEITETQRLYLSYWRPLLEELKTVHRWGSIQTENKGSSYRCGSGLGPGYGRFPRIMRFTAAGDLRVELEIRGPDRDWNKRVFDLLVDSREKIEESSGPYLWERLDGAGISRVAAVRTGSLRDPEPQLEEHRRWMIEQVISFPRAFRSQLERVQRIVDGEREEASGEDELPE